LLSDARWEKFSRKLAELALGNRRLREVRVSPGNYEALARLGLQDLKNGASLEELLRRPEMTMGDLDFLDPELAGLSLEVRDELETGIKYAGYIRRQQEQVERFRHLEDLVIPAEFDFEAVHGLSAEVREKLKLVAPRTLGQAGRIPGVTPAAIAILAVLLRR
jgi:tRNA uridine 5-carboxymethylaminomethyl modification enzyme